MKRNLIVTGALVLAMCAGMTGCSVTTSNSSDSQGNNDNAATNTSNTNDNNSNNSSSNATKPDDAVALTLGQTAKNDNLELTLDTVEWADELVTPAQSDFGTYQYIEPKEGNSLLVISGTYKNLGAGAYAPHSAAEAEIKINDKYTVDAKVTWALPDDHLFSNGRVEPLATANIYIYANVTAEMKSALQTATLAINFKGYEKTGDSSYTIKQDSIGKFKLDFKA